jgi:hypothetical protein
LASGSTPTGSNGRISFPAPLAFLPGRRIAVLYRFGVAVLFGLSPLEEDEIVKKIGLRVAGASRGDDETLIIEATPDGEEKALPDGRLAAKDLSEARLLVIADVLAKSVALGRDERRVNAVFDTIEPRRRACGEGKPAMEAQIHVGAHRPDSARAASRFRSRRRR